jgi:hypothetical protein
VCSAFFAAICDLLTEEFDRSSQTVLSLDRPLVLLAGSLDDEEPPLDDPVELATVIVA